MSTERNSALALDDPKDQDLEDAMKKEKSRGERRSDTEALRLTRERLKVLQKALHARAEREFIEAIRGFGRADDPVKLREDLNI
jgi:hypothetical protein